MRDRAAIYLPTKQPVPGATPQIAQLLKPESSADSSRGPDARLYHQAAPKMTDNTGQGLGVPLLEHTHGSEPKTPNHY